MTSRSPLAANAILAAGGVALAGALLLLLEGGLRGVAVGNPDPARPSRLRYQAVRLPLLEPAALADGSAVLRSADPRLPVQWLRAEKPAGGLRVLVFGGSAAAGLGFSPNATFARALARALEAAHPGRPVEVLNLGIVAFAARQVRQLVADAARRYAPDALVVYSGNNEFLELHAEKYARATGGAAVALADALRDTNLYRLLARALRGPPRAPSLEEVERGREALRLSEDALVREVATGPEEIDGVVAAYAAELEAMVGAAREARTPIVLMTVASNWRWRGRRDLPTAWRDELLPPELGDPERRRARLGALLEERLRTAPPAERHEWLFRRALLREERGDLDGARGDYRAAMNADPRLRRALDAGNEALRRIARERGAPLVDAVAVLAADAPGGIPGFEAFYDYVHLRPRGAELLGAALFAVLHAERILPPAPGFDPSAHRAQRLAELARLREDPLAVGEWLGFGFDPARIADRDLWKYDRLLRELDGRIEASPDDARALTYRGNARSFRRGAAAGAEADYRRALAAPPSAAALAAIRDNLSRLLARGGW